jgi:hypothetical protein
LDNYNGLANPKDHIQNVRNIIELVTQDNDVMITLPRTVSMRGPTWIIMMVLQIPKITYKILEISLSL